ncbi:asparagine synthase (glutamine-hydrolyzing) [Sulfurimonas sp.]|uniref:asparagine synthase (glutamine-hydrolyzing) n=1 Tax=Sulfurimonas sp. TaxID=2022749 RepID=UPI002B47FF9C|nr:asparagine synthase (glutamine-hydrolyzing) [Sulfurimonas sp.]
MCGIVGFVAHQNNKLLKDMNDALVHRGPDSLGSFNSKTVSLAMRRLSIVDIESGSQPYYSKDKSIVVVFNGEIYNHKELRNELISKGYCFSSSHSDGEIIPNMYLEYGVDFVNKLNGMFAIALYDVDKQKLLLYRDRLGKKPLYYTSINKEFYFASEIKALLKIKNDFKIDKHSLINYLQLKNTSAPDTIYEDIKQVNSASYIEYDLRLKTYVENKYWDLDFSKKTNLSEHEISKKLITLLEDAVKIRTECDVEYGAFLSGGLDSSLVCSIITQTHNKNLMTFSLGYKDDFKNKQSDLYHARKLSEKLGTNHYEYILDSKEVFDELSDALRAFDEPFSGTISTYFLTKLISKNVKVALCGDGADELFGSYLTHRLSTPIENYLNNTQHIKPFDSKEEFEFLKHIADEDIAVWRNKLNVFSDDELNSLFLSNIDIPNPYKNITTTAKTMLDKCLEIDEKELLVNQILPFTDRLSMAHSLEVRSPFLDYRIVEFAAQIPSSLKIKDTVNKYILKKSASKYLDDEIINRPKEGFVLPVYQWIEEEYFDEVYTTILHSNMIDDFEFNKIYIKNLLDTFKIQKKQHAKIWNLYTLAVWYEGIK